MSDTFDDFFDKKKQREKRSTFLTVLCILTFLGSTMFIVQNGYLAIHPESQLKNMTNMEKGQTNASNPFVQKMMPALEEFKDFEKTRNNATAGAISGIMTLVGAVLMFKQNKKGFYLYVAGCFLSIITPYIIYPDNMIIKMGLAFTLFISIVFTIMYAFCLKEMR